MGAELKAYPQLVFSLSIKGVVKMDYKIENLLLKCLVMKKLLIWKMD